MVAVIDYGMGNLRSVLNALERLGADAILVRRPEDLDGAAKLILPGVGAFGDGMRNLRERGFADALRELVCDGRPLLGICLGMQLLATTSHEYGEHGGLDLLPGTVRYLETDPVLRVPHVGWNGVAPRGRGSLFTGLPEEPIFYFVHSYHVLPDDPDDVSATAEYGIDVTAAVERDHVYGVQFHPEKSQRDGLSLLRNFLAL